MHTKISRFKKKGITQADWAISLGLFILYLAFVFIIARPLLINQLPDSSVSLLLDAYLKDEIYTDVLTTPFELDSYTTIPLTILSPTHYQQTSSLQVYSHEDNITFDFVPTQSMILIFQKPKTQGVSLVHINDGNNRTALLGKTGSRTGTTYNISADQSEAIMTDPDTHVYFSDNRAEELQFQGTSIISEWKTNRSGIPIVTTESTFEKNGFLAIYDSVITPTSSNPSSADYYPVLRSQYASAQVSGIVTMLHPYTEPITLDAGEIPESEYAEQLTAVNVTTMITPTQSLSFNGTCQSYAGSTVALSNQEYSLVFHTPHEFSIEACHLNQTTEITLRYTHTISKPFWLSTIVTDQPNPLGYRPQTAERQFSHSDSFFDITSLEKLKTQGDDVLQSVSGIPQQNKIRLELMIPSTNNPEQEDEQLISIGPNLPLQGDISATSRTVPIITNSTTIPYAKRILYTWT